MSYFHTLTFALSHFHHFHHFHIFTFTLSFLHFLTLLSLSNIDFWNFTLSLSHIDFWNFTLSLSHIMPPFSDLFGKGRGNSERQVQVGSIRRQHSSNCTSGRTRHTWLVQFIHRAYMWAGVPAEMEVFNLFVLDISLNYRNTVQTDWAETKIKPI